MAAEVASAFVTLMPTAKGFGKGIERQIGGDVDRTGKRAGSKFGGAMGLGAAAGVARAFAPVGAALAAAGVGSWLMGTADAASDLNETVNKANVIFGKNAGQMEKWASTAATTMGLSKAAALDAAAGFGDMFSQIGFSGNEATKMSQKVVQMSADLGSFNNMPTEDVAQRIAAAFRGEYDSLQALIPNINAARVESEALAMTGKKNAKELTAQEKAAATLAIVQKDGARAMGDFANTSDGVANKSKIQAARMEDLKTKVGALTLPLKSLAIDAFGALISFGEKALPVISNAITTVGGFVTSLFQGASAGSTMGGVVASLGNWFRVSLMPAINGVIGAVRGFVAVALPIVVSFVTGMQARMAPMVPVVKSIFSTVAQIVVGALGLVRAIIERVTAVIGYVWRNFGGNIMAVISTVWSAVLRIVQAALNVVRSVISVATNVIKGNWSGAWTAIKGLLANVWGLIKTIISSALSVVRSVISNGLSVVKSLWSSAWNAVKGVLSGAWGGIKSGVSAGIGAVVGFIRSLPGKALSALGNIGGTLLSAGRSLIQGFLDGIMEKFNAVKAKLGELTSWLPDWKGPASLDKVILRDNGRLVMGGFIDGLEDRYGDVEGSLGGLTKSLSVSSPSLPGARAGAAGSGGTAVFNIYDADGVLLGSMRGAAKGVVQAQSREARYGGR